MKIKRTINGQEYEFQLTQQELYSAYSEQEHQYDQEDIRGEFEEQEPWEIYGNYGIAAKYLSELVPQMAYEKRRLIDKYGMNWETACGEAIRTVVSDYKQEVTQDLKQKTTEEKVAYYREGMSDQIEGLADSGSCTQEQRRHLIKKLDAVTERYVLKLESLDADDVQLSASEDVELMQEILLAEAENALEEQITYADAIITMEAGQLMVQLPDETEKRYLRSHIQDIHNGNAFIVGEAILTAEGDAHQNCDERDKPWIVYDEFGNNWFEEDIANANLMFNGRLRETMFIFDEELCLTDGAENTIDGYLWAMAPLVDRLKQQLADQLSAGELESMENINFYPVYHVATGNVEVEAHFCYTMDNGQEAAHGGHLQLTDSESAFLKASMEDYCKEKYNVSCLEFLENAKTAEAHETVYATLQDKLTKELAETKPDHFENVRVEVPLTAPGTPGYGLVVWGENNGSEDKFYYLSVHTTDAAGEAEEPVPGLEIFSESESFNDLRAAALSLLDRYEAARPLLPSFDVLPENERNKKTKALNDLIAGAQLRAGAAAGKQSEKETER